MHWARDVSYNAAGLPVSLVRLYQRGDTPGEDERMMATRNVTWMPNPTGYEYFEYDADNRLVRAATGGEPWVRYRYGLDNRRLWRAV